MVMDRLNAHKADNPSMGEVRCWDIYDALIVSLFFFINILYLATHILQTFFSFFNLKWHFLTAVSFSYSVFWTIFSSLFFFLFSSVSWYFLSFRWVSMQILFLFFVMLCWIHVLFTSNLSSVSLGSFLSFAEISEYSSILQLQSPELAPISFNK